MSLQNLRRMIWLLIRVRDPERMRCCCERLHSTNPRVRLKRNPEPFCCVQLWDQVDIGQARALPEAEAFIPNYLFNSSQPLTDPVSDPVLDRLLLVPHLTQPIKYRYVVQRMDVACDEGGHTTLPGTQFSIVREQGYLWISLLQEFDDCWRLNTFLPVILQQRHTTLWVFGNESRFLMLSPQEVDRNVFVVQTFQSKCDSHPI